MTNEQKQEARATRLCNLAAGMVSYDSPVEFVNAAVDMAFLIEKKVKETIDNGR